MTSKIMCISEENSQYDYVRLLGINIPFTKSHSLMGIIDKHKPDIILYKSYGCKSISYEIVDSNLYYYMSPVINNNSGIDIFSNGMSLPDIDISHIESDEINVNIDDTKPNIIFMKSNTSYYVPEICNLDYFYNNMYNIHDVVNKYNSTNMFLEGCSNRHGIFHRPKIAKENHYMKISWELRHFHRRNTSDSFECVEYYGNENYVYSIYLI